MSDSKTLVGGLAIATSFATIFLSIPSAHAATLLNVDLTVPNQITISSTTGASAATISGATFTGFYLENLFNSTTSARLDVSLVSGNLTTSLNPSDNTPSLFRDSRNDPGLNVWTFSTDSTVDFQEEVRAFVGSATWNINPAAYNLLVAGPSSGDIYFPADDVNDLGSATVIGQYSVVPEPLTMLGAGAAVAFGAAFKRRKAQ